MTWHGALPLERWHLCTRRRSVRSSIGRERLKASAARVRAEEKRQMLHGISAMHRECVARRSSITVIALARRQVSATIRHISVNPELGTFVACLEMVDVAPTGERCCAPNAVTPNILCCVHGRGVRSRGRPTRFDRGGGKMRASGGKLASDAASLVHSSASCLRLVNRSDPGAGLDAFGSPSINSVASHDAGRTDSRQNAW